MVFLVNIQTQFAKKGINLKMTSKGYNKLFIFIKIEGFFRN